MICQVLGWCPLPPQIVVFCVFAKPYIFKNENLFHFAAASEVSQESSATNLGTPSNTSAVAAISSTTATATSSNTSAGAPVSPPPPPLPSISEETKQEVVIHGLTEESCSKVVV